MEPLVHYNPKNNPTPQNHQVSPAQKNPNYLSLTQNKTQQSINTHSFLSSNNDSIDQSRDILQSPFNLENNTISPLLQNKDYLNMIFMHEAFNIYAITTESNKNNSYYDNAPFDIGELHARIKNTPPNELEDRNPNFQNEEKIIEQKYETEKLVPDINNAQFINFLKKYTEINESSHIFEITQVFYNGNDIALNVYLKILLENEDKDLIDSLYTIFKKFYINSKYIQNANVIFTKQITLFSSIVSFIIYDTILLHYHNGDANSLFGNDLYKNITLKVADDINTFKELFLEDNTTYDSLLKYIEEKPYYPETSLGKYTFYIFWATKLYPQFKNLANYTISSITELNNNVFSIKLHNKAKQVRDTVKTRLAIGINNETANLRGASDNLYIPLDSQHLISMLPLNNIDDPKKPIINRLLNSPHLNKKILHNSKYFKNSKDQSISIKDYLIKIIDDETAFFSSQQKKINIFFKRILIFKIAIFTLIATALILSLSIYLPFSILFFLASLITIIIYGYTLLSFTNNRLNLEYNYLTRNFLINENNINNNQSLFKYQLKITRSIITDFVMYPF
ncbi:MAG: AmpG family muropeptide MFS transporter [Bacteroidetes bacterium]|nr:AmpG family muropeptide MFS transporter [Bacteroidota bacterium]